MEIKALRTLVSLITTQYECTSVPDMRKALKKHYKADVSEDEIYDCFVDEREIEEAELTYKRYGYGTGRD